MTYTFDSLHPYLIGRGAERWCFQHPEKSDMVIKLSPENAARQTNRELAYLGALRKRGVPFSHLPKVGSVVRVPGYVGFEEEQVRDFDGKPSRGLWWYLEKADDSIKQKLPAVLEELRVYFHRHAVVLCDLNVSNILVQEIRKGEYRAMMIDGTGTTDFIPLCRYVPLLARMKLKRQWARFMKNTVLPQLEKKTSEK